MSTVSKSQAPEGDQLELQVELVCEETKSTKLKRLTLQSDPHTFLDIKRAIEKSFSIPVCVQSLLHQSNKVTDTDTPSQCYLRDGDTLQVTYPIEGECERVIEVIQLVRTLNDALLKIEFRDDGKSVAANTLPEFFSLYDQGDAIDAMDEIAFDLIYPWLEKKKYVNKLHIDSLGGVKIMMSIYQRMLKLLKISTLRPRVNIPHMASKCSLFVANFTHTFPLRRRIVMEGGLDMCIQSFLTTASWSWRYGYDCEIVRTALYALCNISELPEVQLKLAQRVDVTEQALNVALARVFNCDTAIVSVMYFICLVQCPEALSYLTQPSIIKKLLVICESRRQSNSVTSAIEKTMTLESYTCFLISMMVLRSVNYLLNISAPLGLVNKIIDLMDSVCEWSSMDILSYETKEGLVWATFLPHITYLYHPVDLHGYDIVLSSEVATAFSKLHDLSTTILLRSLLNAFTRDIHVNVLIEENILDYVVLLPWYVPEKCRPLARDVLKEVSKFVQIRPPSLCSMAKAKLAKSSTGLKRTLDMRSISDLFN